MLLEEEATIRGCGTGLGPADPSDRSRVDRGTQASADHSANEWQQDNYAPLGPLGERYLASIERKREQQ